MLKSCEIRHFLLQFLHNIWHKMKEKTFTSRLPDTVENSQISSENDPQKYPPKIPPNFENNAGNTGGISITGWIANI